MNELIGSCVVWLGTRSRRSPEATVTRVETPFSGNEAFQTGVTEGFERWTDHPETSIFPDGGIPMRTIQPVKVSSWALGLDVSVM